MVDLAAVDTLEVEATAAVEATWSTREQNKDVWGRGCASTYDNSCICLFVCLWPVLHCSIHNTMQREEL